MRSSRHPSSNMRPTPPPPPPRPRSSAAKASPASMAHRLRSLSAWVANAHLSRQRTGVGARLQRVRDLVQHELGVAVDDDVFEPEDLPADRAHGGIAPGVLLWVMPEIDITLD